MNTVLSWLILLADSSSYIINLLEAFPCKTGDIPRNNMPSGTKITSLAFYLNTSITLLQFSLTLLVP